MLYTQIYAAHYTAVVPLGGYPYMYIANYKITKYQRDYLDKQDLQFRS